jgi:hypothetical protein
VRATGIGAVIRNAASGPPPTQRYPLRALRMAVLLPGAFLEGALLVLLPWAVTRASLGTPWLGVLSGLIVAAAMVGNLLAPLTTAWWGSRRMVIAGACVSAVCVAAATAAWFFDLRVHAFVLALFAVVADNMADVGFAARMPFVARVSGQPLLKFSATNWLWGIVGAAMGSACAGWALTEAAEGMLLVTISGLSLAVAFGLLMLLPRDPRARPRSVSILRQFGSAAVWTPRAIVLTAGIAWLSFVYGPVDNLLLPARLASEQRDATTFGAMMAAGGIGLAVGLLLTQRRSTATNTASGRSGGLLIIGVVGMLAQLLLLWWLPDRWILVAGSFATAAFIAPLLPVLESAILLAARSAHRTVLLALVGIIATAADLAGTAVLGTVASSAGPRSALMLALMLAAAGAFALLALWFSVVPQRPGKNRVD